MFEFNNGACQGDSLSGKIFTLNLAGALYQIRIFNVSIPRPIVPISAIGMPMESEYADDVEYIDEKMETLEKIMETAPTILEYGIISGRNAVSATTAIQTQLKMK